MIDPDQVTDYGRGDDALAEFFVYAVCVAGKKAAFIAPAVARLLALLGGETDPLPAVRRAGPQRVALALRACGIGCFTQKAGAICRAAALDGATPGFLRTATVADLEGIHGVGAKTARFFVLHTRPGEQVAAVDTHILKHLKSRGHRVPKQTPAKGPTYRRLEEACLALADQVGMCPADYDLMVWRKYRRKT